MSASNYLRNIDAVVYVAKGLSSQLHRASEISATIDTLQRYHTYIRRLIQPIPCIHPRSNTGYVLLNNNT